MNRKEAKQFVNTVKYGMSYDLEGDKGFTGHEAMIDKIYDEIESRLCKNCIYDTGTERCNKFVKRPLNRGNGLIKDFGCVWFERTTDG